MKEMVLKYSYSTKQRFSKSYLDLWGGGPVGGAAITGNPSAGLSDASNSPMAKSGLMSCFHTLSFPTVIF